VTALEVLTGENPRFSVIWLHGLGADGHDFEPIVPELGLPATLPTRFVFPNAPMMAVTINGGYVMPAWYDVTSQNLGEMEDERGIRASQQALEKLIQQEEARGIPSNRIILAGFSQGGAIALFTALRFPRPLGGVLALSTYLPLPQKLANEAHASNAALPVFMGHGQMDGVITLAQGAAAHDFLVSRGIPVKWREYAMAHSVCPEEIRDIGGWIRGILLTQ
jgi:phospholipase/carboxylesterase